MGQLQAAGGARTARWIGDGQPHIGQVLKPANHLAGFGHQGGFQMVGERLHRIHDHHGFAAAGVAHNAVPHIDKPRRHEGRQQGFQGDGVVHGVGNTWICQRQEAR